MTSAKLGQLRLLASTSATFADSDASVYSAYSLSGDAARPRKP